MITKSFKELPEGTKHFVGLISLVVTIFLFFFLLNTLFYEEIVSETLIVEEEEKYTYGPGGEKGGIVTGKVVFTYVIGKEGERIELGQKTYRSSDGPTGTTRTIIQYAPEMQQRLKDAEARRDK